MGLQVWLPLNGDANNQGLTEISTVGGPAFSDGGILGKAFSNNSLAILNFSTIPCLSNGHSFTFCFWVKSTSASQTVTFFDCGNTTGIGTRLHFAVNNNVFRFGFRADDLDGPTLSANQWSHIACAYDGNKKYIYINGVLNTSGNSGQLKIPGTTYSANFNCSTMNMNDFRLYDYCLSPREIKEISKGLVLHYPLSQIGADNNIKTSAIVNRGCTTFSFDGVNTWDCVSPVSTNTWGTGFVINDTSITFSIGQTWMVSMEVKPDVNCPWNDDINNKPQVDSSSYTGNDYDDINNRKVWTNGVLGSKQLTANIWNKVVFSQTAKDYDLFNYSTNFGIVTSALSAPVSYQIRNIKGEIGDHVTPWMPNSSDTAYAALGFNDGIEYDVSGYKNNGTKAGTLTYDADTPRYNTSTVFDGTTHIINNTNTIHLSNEFTISWWGKINTWRQVWEGMFLLQNTTALNNASGTYSIANAIHASTANIMTLTIRQGGTNYPFDHYQWTYTVGAWGHYACTYKDGVIIMYQNGVQTYTATIDNNSSGDYYYTIGKRVYNCNCQMSDFRIYNTALSADDILELYHTPISLSNNGTLLTQGEYVES